MSIVSGRPQPRVSWWRNSELIDNSYEVLSERRVRNTLHLENLKRQSIHDTYTCQASNNNQVHPLSANLSTTKDENVTISSLSFVPGMEDSGKFLTCRVGTTPHIVEDGWKLNIHHFSKAFDRVSHPHLLAKPSSHGIHGPLLDWFSSYLCGRKLVVKFASCTSRSFSATSGVPQGSHLGPVLFNIFINDISRVIHVKHLLFADDIKLYSTINSIDDFYDLQDSLSAVERWCGENCMALNTSKCVIMTFHRTLAPIFHNYGLNGCNLDRVFEIKDFGVMCTASLSPEKHVLYISAKANKNLGLITRYSRSFSSPLALKTLYCHLVRSHLEYCSVVWSPYQLYLQERLQSIQTRFIRLVGLRLGYRYADVPVCALAAVLDLRTLVYRRKVFDLMFLHRLVNGEILCPELLERISFHVPGGGTRSRELFARSYHATLYEQHSAIARIQAMGNSLPPEIDFFNCNTTCFRRLISSLPLD
ncbi:uncharacterized protein LOC129000783 [Macrosteles quadrilineatus]|uniref:uncharacterized protein LOC129000783 n=1 Tax=Macrosteles quadrilineatus TaxID=74068 RepID=UPI0023E11D8E|nr:uncharacterized protein LOC129000783 [Macrosteles quadrilineatus]